MSHESLGPFHSTQNSGHFGWYIKWNRRLVQPEYSGPALKVALFDRSGPFPFGKIVFPSTALLYPAYKNNNQTRGGLGRVCATGMYRSIGHVEFPKFQMGIFLEWKARNISNLSVW